MIDQIVVRERLLDHQQFKIIQRTQVFFVCNRVGAISIDGQQNLWITRSCFANDVEIPTWLDLKFDPAVTKREVSLNSFKQVWQSRLNAEAYSYRNAGARPSDQLR